MSRAAVVVLLVACGGSKDPERSASTSGANPRPGAAREAQVRAALVAKGLVVDTVYCTSDDPCDVAVAGAKITVDTNGSAVTPRGVVLDTQRLADEIGDGLEIHCAQPVILLAAPTTCPTANPDGHIALTPKLEMDDVSWELVP